MESQDPKISITRAHKTVQLTKPKSGPNGEIETVGKINQFC